MLMSAEFRGCVIWAAPKLPILSRVNILFVLRNTKTIRFAYKLKYNRRRKNQVVSSMIKIGIILLWKVNPQLTGYNRPVISLSRLLRGITSNHIGDFYCLGCLHSFPASNVLKKHERLCDNHDYCHLKMPTEENEILKYNHGEK